MGGWGVGVAEMSSADRSIGYNYPCLQLSSHLFKADLSITLALVLPILKKALSDDGAGSCSPSRGVFRLKVNQPGPAGGLGLGFRG